jgi:hypothetical protein
MRQLFPFTAIVGQEKMKRALILNAINPQIGGSRTGSAAARPERGGRLPIQLRSARAGTDV